jgi:uncharacterized integral membrane protein (TIGR00698 family)
LIQSEKPVYLISKKGISLSTLVIYKQDIIMIAFNPRPLLAGILLTMGVALVATALGQVFPLIGPAVFGILGGIALRSRFQPGEQYLPGIRFSAKQILQWSIVALGFCLPISLVAHTGLHSLPVTLITLSTAFICALCAGRWLRVPTKLCLLIGTGTAICGGSAIAAITPVLKPDDHDTAFSLSTIFLFNIVAVLLFPLIGHLLGLSDHGFGLWAGTAINDTSSVVAAAYSWSSSAGEYATVVKLTRAMLIIPVTLLIGIVVSLRQHTPGSGLPSIRHASPWFIVWFVLASLTGQYLPPVLGQLARLLAPFLITMALTAIGLSTDLARMKQTGWRPVLLGLLVWGSVASSSLLVQHFTQRW